MSCQYKVGNMDLIIKSDLKIITQEQQLIENLWGSARLVHDNLRELYVLSSASLKRMKSLHKQIMSDCQSDSFSNEIDENNEFALRLISSSDTYFRLSNECLMESDGPTILERIMEASLFIIRKRYIKIAKLNIEIARLINEHDAKVLGIPDVELPSNKLMAELNKSPSLQASIDRINNSNFSEHKLLHE